MIYLTTGANGSGKTLLTLRDVRAQQLKENRPVYYNGFEMDPAKAAEFGWQKFEPSKWQDLPDGSICIMDECQNEFPLRKSSQEVPDYVQAIAQFRRKRGFDFWMICPHPTLLDVFVRRLIDKPSWHRHLKRAFGGDMVSCLKFSSPDLKCEEPGAGARGEVTMVAYPKEVYGWYKSASLHTAKRQIPKKVYVLVACVLAVPVLGWLAWSSLMSRTAPKGVAAPSVLAGVPDGPAMRGAGGAREVLTPEQYMASYQPRVEGLPYTAPRYDEVTRPTDAPYPAACVEMGKRCECFTQQGTRLRVPHALCTAIVKGGFFMDWQTGGAQGGRVEGGGRQVVRALPSVPPAQRWQGGMDEEGESRPFAVAEGSLREPVRSGAGLASVAHQFRGR